MCCVTWSRSEWASPGQGGMRGQELEGQTADPALIGRPGVDQDPQERPELPKRPEMIRIICLPLGSGAPLNCQDCLGPPSPLSVGA